jgi:predicted amidohydrolase YtcJ
MTGRHVLLVVVSALMAGVSWIGAQGAPLDVLLVNGKIITVDERFTVAQALGVRGDRIAAVGSNADVSRLAGAATRRVDLAGKAVIPGLIDNHMHLLRAGHHLAARGAPRRRRLARACPRAASGARRSTPPGEWIYTLGGWTLEQFADDARPFTREELDRVAPRHPVLLQASYYRSYLNSRALEALGVTGSPTGEIEEAGIRALAARLPTASGDALEPSTRAMFRELNKGGADRLWQRRLRVGGAAALSAPGRTPAARRSRVLHTGAAASSPAQVDRAPPAHPRHESGAGQRFHRRHRFGESVYGPAP